MRASRGMGAIDKGKQPKQVTRTDNPNEVDVYAKGGKLNIKSAIKKPGQLHRDLNVPAGKKIPASKIEAAAKGSGKVAQRARFAKVLKGLH